MTIEHPPADDDAPTRSFWFRSAARSHPGAVRATNEDAVLDCSDQGLWAVADGMGGHEAGAIASSEVIAFLSDIVSHGRDLLSVDHIIFALETCNDELRHLMKQGSGRQMGSTVVCLLLSGRCLSCVWAGDSRFYRFRRGMLEQLSRDHSYVQELIDSGHLDVSQAREHPHANVITRAVGVMQHLELDIFSDVIEDGDRFMLCSDGLTRTLNELEIATALMGEDPDEAVDVLLQQALDRGARDNVTLVVIDCDPISRRC